jgi:hypothetical protein
MGVHLISVYVMDVPLTGMYRMGVHFMKRAWYACASLIDVRFLWVCISYGRASLIGVPLADTYLIGVHAMGVHLMACILWVCIS